MKITRCLPFCGRNLPVKKDMEQRKKIEKRIRNVEKTDRDEWEWTIKKKFDEEIELDKVKVKEMVSQKFHRWLKVFRKVELKRMPTRKPWDYAINLKEDFFPRKGRTYLMSRQEKEEVREFVEKQLKKGYIKLSKSPQTSPVFFVGKKNRKKRMVQDYRYLNKGTGQKE